MHWSAQTQWAPLSALPKAIYGVVMEPDAISTTGIATGGSENDHFIHIETLLPSDHS